MNTGEYFALGTFIVFASIPVTVAILSRIKPKQMGREVANEPPRPPKLLKNFYTGHYLGGIPGGGITFNISYDITYCTVEGDYFKFTGGFKGIEFERIRRDRVNEIIVEDKSKVAQRLNGIEKTALNKIVYPETKQGKYYCLVIDWNDHTGGKQYSFFQFAGSGKEGLANSAANTLRRWLSREKINGENFQSQAT